MKTLESEDYVAVVENFSSLGEIEQFQVKTSLRNYLDAFDTDTVVNIWNTYVSEYKDYSVYINENDEYFFQQYFPNQLEELARAICQGDYRNTDPYVWFNDYGNLESGKFLQNLPFDTDELAEDILENQETFTDVLNDFVTWCEDNEIIFAEVTDERTYCKTDKELVNECLADINKICGTNLYFDGCNIFENKGDGLIHSTPLFPAMTSYTSREALKEASDVLHTLYVVKNGRVTIKKIRRKPNVARIRISYKEK